MAALNPWRACERHEDSPAEVLVFPTKVIISGDFPASESRRALSDRFPLQEAQKTELQHSDDLRTTGWPEEHPSPI